MENERVSGGNWLRSAARTSLADAANCGSAADRVREQRAEVVLAQFLDEVAAVGRDVIANSVEEPGAREPQRNLGGSDTRWQSCRAEDDREKHRELRVSPLRSTCTCCRPQGQRCVSTGRSVISSVNWSWDALGDVRQRALSRRSRTSCPPTGAGGRGRGGTALP